jgi:hypothetical protein
MSFELFGAICTFLGLSVAFIYWLLKISYRTGQIIQQLSELDNKVQKSLHLFTKIHDKVEDHNVRIAVIETRIESNGHSSEEQ